MSASATPLKIERFEGDRVFLALDLVRLHEVDAGPRAPAAGPSEP
jgi:hypothetical protein